MKWCDCLAIGLAWVAMGVATYRRYRGSLHDALRMRLLRPVGAWTRGAGDVDVDLVRGLAATLADASADATSERKPATGLRLPPPTGKPLNAARRLDGGGIPLPSAPPASQARRGS